MLSLKVALLTGFAIIGFIALSIFGMFRAISALICSWPFHDRENKIDELQDNEQEITSRIIELIGPPDS